MDDTRRSSIRYDKIETVEQNGKTVNIGKVTASIDECSSDVLNVIYKVLSGSNSSVVLLDPNKYFLNDTYRAWSKANYSKGDTFDEQVGKELAKDRCLAKYHKQMNKKLLQFLFELRETVATMEHYLEKRSIDFSGVSSIEDIKKNKFTH